jgi:hypothetical protein
MPLDQPGLEELVDTYARAWSDADPERRRQLLASVWAEGGTYTDPTVHTVGADALAAHVDGVLAQLPGARVERVSAVDAHHGVARFAWRLVQADGTALPDGLDCIDVTEDGRISRVVGFFGPLG